jgi:fibronectin type 3 domain-containing protein
MRLSKGVVVVIAGFLLVIAVSAYRFAQESGPKKPHSVTLTWDASPGADFYNIYRKPENGSFAKIGTVQTNKYVDTPVPSGTVLIYGVTTVSKQQESAISKEIRVEVPKD